SGAPQMGQPSTTGLRKTRVDRDDVQALHTKKGPGHRQRDRDHVEPRYVLAQPQLSLSKETVMKPLAFIVACAFSWDEILEPSEPVRWRLDVACSTSFWRLFSSPNQSWK